MFGRNDGKRRQVMPCAAQWYAKEIPLRKRRSAAETTAHEGALGTMQTITYQRACMLQMLNLDTQKRTGLGAANILATLPAPAASEQYDHCGLLDARPGLACRHATSGGLPELRGVPRLACSIACRLCPARCTCSHLLADCQIACTRTHCGVLLYFGKAATACGSVSLIQIPYMLPSGH
jgi:hypothetical protein